MTQEESRENAHRPAGFVVRAVALFIDFLIIAVAQVPPLLAFWTIDRETPWNLAFHIVYLQLLTIYAIASSIVPFWLYASWFERSKLRGTPGKYIMDLAVVDSKGAPLSFWRSTARLTFQYTIISILTVAIALVVMVKPQMMANFAIMDVLNLIDLICIIYALGTAWCFFNKQKQTLFDLPVGRYVVFAKTNDSEPAISESPQPNVRGVERIRACAQLAWSELPKFRMRLPVLVFYGAYCALILFNFGWVLSQANQVHSIESKIEQSGGKLSLLAAFEELGIKPQTARHSYENISELFGTLLDGKALRTYRERANQIHSDSLSVTRLAKLAAAENNLDEAARLLTEFGNSQTDSMVERGTAYALASTFTKDKAKKTQLLKWAMTYAPCSINVLKEKLKADRESNDAEQTKIDQEQIDYVTQHPRSTIEDMTGVTSNNVIRDSKQGAEQILEHYPDNNVALLFTAQYLVNEDKGKEAEQLYSQVIAHDTTDPLPYERRAYFYSHEKEPELDKALADINKAIALDPQNSYLQQKISILKKKNDFAGANAAIMEASKSQPDFLKLASDAIYLSDHGYKRDALALVRLACDAYKTNMKVRVYVDDSNAYGVSPRITEAIESFIEVADTCGSKADTDTADADTNTVKDAIQDLINRAIPGRSRLALLELLNKSKQ